MSLDYAIDDWNSLTSSDYGVPTEESPGSASDSSGNVPSGLSLGTLLKFGGSLFSAYGSLVAGKQSQQADRYNAQLALAQEGFAQDKLDKAEVSMISTQRAMYAKSGVEMTGSPLDVALHTATGFEMDKQITRYNAQSKANMYEYEGAVARSQGQIKAGMALLSGGAQLGAAMFL